MSEIDNDDEKHMSKGPEHEYQYTLNDSSRLKTWSNITYVSTTEGR